MEFTSPSGRKYQWNKDTPPTPEDIQQIVDYDASLDAQARAQTSKEVQPSLGRQAADVGTEIAGSVIGQGLGAFGGPAAPVTVPLGGAAGGAIANLIVQKGQISRGEREAFSLGELLSASALSAIPGGKAAKGATTLGKQVAKAAGKQAALGTAISVGSEAARVGIDEKRLLTPEETYKSLALGAITGAGLGVTETLVSKGIGKAVSGIREYGAIKDFIEPIKRIAGEQSALAADGEVAIKEFHKSLNRIKNKQDRELQASRSYDYLKGETNLSNVSPEVAPHVKLVRQIIDEASERQVRAGMFDDNIALRNAIVDNFGSYMNRSYKVFNGWRPDKNLFNEFVTEKTKDKVEQLTRMAMATRMKIATNTYNRTGVMPKLQSLSQVRENILKKKPQIRQGYIELANSLMDRDFAAKFIANESNTRLNAVSSAYKRKQSIDDLTSRFLGRINDPVYLAAETLNKMTASEAKFNAMKKIAEIGQRTGLFRINQVMGDVELNSRPGLLNPFVVDTVDLNGKKIKKALSTTAEIRDALNAYTNNDVDPIIQKFGAIASLSSALKLPKTLGSLKGYASNAWGGIMDTIGQGHALQFLRSGNYRVALDNFLNQFQLKNPNGSVNNEMAFFLYKIFKREGLITGNIGFSDFKRGVFFEDKSFANRFSNDIKSRLSGGIETLGKLYSAPETASKVFNFYGELAALNKANLKMTEDDLYKEAARKVRLTTQDYNSLPRFLKNFSSIGFLDPFVSYTADRFRVVYNTYKLGIEEINSGNRALILRGANRLSSMTAMLGAASYAGSNFHLSKEEEQAVRNRMPSWDKDGLVRIDKNEDGTYSYLNLNYNIPASIVIEAAQLASRGASPEEAFSKFMSSISKQAFGTHLLAAPIAELVTGRTQYGTPITTENAPLYKQFYDKSKNFLDSTFNPLTVREVNKFYKALKAKDGKVETPSGQIYGIDDLLLENLGGIRLKTINPESKMKIDAFSLGKAMQDDSIIHASQRKRAQTEAEKEVAYNNYVQSNQNAFGKVQQIINDARVLGMDDALIAEILSSGGISGRTVLGAMTNTYIQPAKEKDTASDELADKVMSLPLNKRASAISQIARDNPLIAKSVSSKVKTQTKDMIRGISPTDRMIRNLDDSDGTRAMYFVKRMGSMTQDESAAYINEMKNKGLITPLVYEQIKAYLVSR